jgi:hypothetical protein
MRVLLIDIYPDCLRVNYMSVPYVLKITFETITNYINEVCF